MTAAVVIVSLATFASGREVACPLAAAAAVRGDAAGSDEGAVVEGAGLVASAAGLELLSRGEIEAAIACLELAARALPDSAAVARDLAAAYAQAGRPAAALSELERAIAAGDPDPEARQLRAILLATLEHGDEAVDAAKETASWEGDLIAASLGDGAAAYRVADLASERTQRGALAALVLAAHAGDHGDQNTARLLTEVAAENAEASSSPIVLNAARALERRLDQHGGMSAAARLRTSIDHATNPEYRAAGTGVHHAGLRVAIAGEGALQIPVGIARIDAALRVDQHAFLRAPEDFADTDLTGFSAAAGVEFPISYSPAAAVVGLRLRFTDVFADRFRLHYATTFEGGPNLVLPLTPSTRLELAVYGVATDFIDVSPPDARISSINRDRVGERAVLALSFRADWLEGRAELMFLRDDARGDAFDAIGGALGGQLRAFVGDGVELETAAAMTAREFGPVGDLSIIGPAATRGELRTFVALGARIPFGGGLSMRLADTWIQSSAHAGHAYTENVLSTGLEQAWW